MQQFGTAEVSRLTDIPVRSIRSMIRAHYVSPSKTERGLLRFSFQDLVVLRTARGLLAARVPPRRIGDALRAVREQLPADLPARALSVSSNGGHVVVHEQGQTREAVSGQLLLAFEVRLEGGELTLIDSGPASQTGATAQPSECEQQFAAALDLEGSDSDAAAVAYRRCVEQHAHPGATANLGRLLHLQGQIDAAIRLYREVHKPDADILYNLAVALEDLGQVDEAISAYTEVLALDADYADAHHNIARLLQQAGDDQRAVRHWNAYRRLSR